MNNELSGIIIAMLSDIIHLLACIKDLERYNRQLNDEQIIELHKQIDKLGSNNTLEDLLLSKCTTKD